MPPSVDRTDPDVPGDLRAHHPVGGATPRLVASPVPPAGPFPPGPAAADVGLALVSTDSLTRGRLVEVSPALGRLVGSTAAALRGRELGDFLHRDDPGDDGGLDDVLTGRRPCAGGVRRLLTAAGETVECQVTASVTHTTDGGRAAMLFSATPLGAAARRARGRLQAAARAVETAPYGIASFDVRGRCTGANRAWTALGGVGMDSGEAHALLDSVLDPGTAQAAVSAATRGIGQELTLQATRPDGTPLVVRAVLAPRTDDAGVAAGFIAYGHETASGAAGGPGRSAVPNADTVGAGVVAQVLGVSVSTVRRWIEEGRLHATRTPGGHRRIARAELRRMAAVMTRPGRLRATDLPARGLPVLGAVLADRGPALTRDAARVTYERAFPGWFAGPAAAPVLNSWCAAAARAIAAGRPGDAIHATTVLFRTARDVALLEECVVFAERLSMLLLERLEQEPGGRLELRDARTILTAMRRTLVILEDQRG